MPLEKFKELLPKEYLGHSDKKLWALLSMFHKMAIACIEIAKNKSKKQRNACIKQSDSYNKSDNTKTLSDES